MYLKPGNLYKSFVIERSVATVSKNGRPTTSYKEVSEGDGTLRGALAEATTQQKIEWSQLQHPITHTIVQDGRPKAKAEDKLVLGNRVFFIQGVEEPGSIGVCTIYYAEERTDVK